MHHGDNIAPTYYLIRLYFQLIYESALLMHLYCGLGPKLEHICNEVLFVLSMVNTRQL